MGRHRADDDPSHMDNETVTIIRDRQESQRLFAIIARAILPWCVLFVAAAPLLRFRWPPYEWSGSFLRWVNITLSDLALVFPFALFAAGVGLARKLGHSRPALRLALVAGLALGSVTYVTDAWLSPMVSHQYYASLGSATEDTRQFGAWTPVGMLRNLRFVEENPPDQYSLSIDSPERQPPNILHWRLHAPLSMAVFGLVNVFLGLLASELTVDLKRGARRTALLAIGVLGGIAFFLALGLSSPIQPFLRSGEFRSGVLTAWLPLSVPLAEGLVLVYLTRSRRYG